MKIFKHITTALLLLLAISVTAQQSINYKALVKDSGGNVVANDLIVVQFQILQGVGMTNVYQETHTPTTDANGLIILNIGEGNTGDTFSALDWSSDEHFLNVQINTGGGLVDMGTTQFMAVPYALSAANAATKIDELSDGKSDADGSSLFLGKDAGLNDDGSDNQNVAVGLEALYSNTTGNENTANGRGALFSNTTGYSNTANGYQALYSNSEGYSNTGNGYQALYSNTTGINNTANGVLALLFNTTGNDNTANGYQALVSNTTGVNNTANGRGALFSNTEGSDNTANGRAALSSNITGGGNTANGYQALYSNTTGFENTANGFEALYSNTTGNLNTAYGYSALGDLTSGTNNIGIGSFAQVPSSTGSNQIRMGNSGIGYAGIQVAWAVTSDERWKENIRALPYGLEFVTQLKPVDYIRKNNDAKTREMGFIAQDIEALLTKVGYKDQGFLSKDDKGFLSLRYNDFITLLTKAIQEQQEIIDELKSENKQQTTKIESQESDIKELMAWKQKVDQLLGTN